MKPTSKNHKRKALTNHTRGRPQKQPARVEFEASLNFSSSSSSSSSLSTILSSSASSLVPIKLSSSFLSENSKKKTKVKLKINVRTLPELHLTENQKNRGQYYINPHLILYSIILICHNKKNVLSLSSEEMDMDTYILVEPAFLLKISSYFKILLDPKIYFNDDDNEKKILHIENFSETVVRSALYMAWQIHLLRETLKTKKGFTHEEEKELSISMTEIFETDYELQHYSLELLIQMAEFAHRYLDFKPLERRFEILIQFILKQQSDKNKNNQKEEDKKNLNKLILNIYLGKLNRKALKVIFNFN